jgi:phytol kinase
VLTPLPPLTAMAVVAAACGVLLGGVTWWRRTAKPPAELTRKAVHVGMGVIALSLPWLFDRTWPVLVLCGGLGVAFLALKLFARRSALGEAMHDVGRSSRGDLYFAASVAALWLLAEGDRLLFVIPVLVLTLGDAVAALVGVRYGQIRFDGQATGKSLEGSVALFIVTFLSVHLPLTLAERVAPIDGILIAGAMSVMIVLLEAVAWRGLDNVFVPVGAFLLLRVWLMLDTAGLLWRLAVIVVLFGVVLWARRRTTLQDAALAGAILFASVVWMLGGWTWVAAPAVVFVSYTRLFPAAVRVGESGEGELREHDMHAVGGVILPALAWLFAGRALRLEPVFVPYTATFMAQLAMIGLVRVSASAPGGGPARLLAIVLTGALAVAPTLLLHRPLDQVPAALGLATAGAILAALAFNRRIDGVSVGMAQEVQWTRQAWWALVASLATLPLLTR